MLPVMRRGCGMVGLTRSFQGSAIQAVRPAQVLQFQKRNLMIQGSDWLADDELDRKFRIFGNAAEQMGCDEHPNIRKEHLKGFSRKIMRKNLGAKQRASRKVAAIIDLVQFKAAYRYH